MSNSFKSIDCSACKTAEEAAKLVLREILKYCFENDWPDKPALLTAKEWHEFEGTSKYYDVEIDKNITIRWDGTDSHSIRDVLRNETVPDLFDKTKAWYCREYTNCFEECYLQFVKREE